MKEATTLADAGYQVEVIGGWFDRALKVRDQELLPRMRFQYTPVSDIVENGSSARFAARLKRKTGEVAYLKGRVENTWQLGYFTSALRQAACRSRADLLIAHSEPAMAAVTEARRRCGCRVGVDMEDWFSEDGTTQAQRLRPVRLLRSLEQNLLNVGAHSSCSSHAMRDALSTEFACEPPVVIYNAFPWSDRLMLDRKIKDRRDLNLPSIHWYSETLGVSRGLEELFAALPYLEHETEIHLRGRPMVDLDEWLMKQVPAEWRSRVFIHGLVTNDELLSRIAEHDIGFAGEGRYCRNREVTVSNKILHYLLAGLAVIASNTAGQCEVAEQAKGAVMIYQSGDPHKLAAQLNWLLASPDNLGVAKAAALNAAEKTFCWERQAPVLLQSIEKALAQQGRRNSFD